MQQTWLSFYSRAVDNVQESNGMDDGIYLNLKNAFDKVPHKRLLWKLKKWNARGTNAKMDGGFLNPFITDTHCCANLAIEPDFSTHPTRKEGCLSLRVTLLLFSVYKVFVFY